MALLPDLNLNSIKFVYWSALPTYFKAPVGISSFDIESISGTQGLIPIQESLNLINLIKILCFKQPGWFRRITLDFIFHRRQILPLISAPKALPEHLTGSEVKGDIL
jgi:hypothetical protein